MTWQSGSLENPEPYYRYSQPSFLRRYWVAINSVAASISGAISYQLRWVLDGVAGNRGYAEPVHPELALLDVGEFRREPFLFIDRLDTASTEQMLAREEWRVFERLLRDFKEISAQHEIVPIIVYVPSAAHIYAQFSTEESGYVWLHARESQIASKKNTFNAVQRLAQSLGIALIDLSPAFEAAAHEGKLLYYRLDSHWNTEGRELAASVVAKALKSDLNPASR